VRSALTARFLFFPLVLLLCVNVFVLSLTGPYSITAGPLTLAAHGMFKPLLYLNAAFLLALLVRPRGSGEPVAAQRAGTLRFLGGALLLAAVAYYPALFVNFIHHDWTHSHISATIHTFGDLAGLFFRQQADLFYRPLGFLSLWLDYSAFGNSLWAYHLQSIGLHVVNCLLFRRLLLLLRVNAAAAGWSALLWLVAAVNWEPVLWPAARFDLLAATFVLAGLCTAVLYLRDEGRASVRLALLCLWFALALAAKETAYCLPLLVLFFALTPKLWELPRARPVKLILMCAALGAVVLLSVGVRLALYGEIGGYRDPASCRALYSIVDGRVWTYLTTRLLVPPLGVNMSVAPDRLLCVAVGLYSLGLLLCVWTFRNWRDRKHLAFLLCAALSALPALAVIGWIGPSMMHSRHLYLPSLWVIAVVAGAMDRCRWRLAVLTLICAANVLGVWHNVSVQRRALDRIDASVRVVLAGLQGRPPGARVALVGVPLSPNGVFLFGVEMAQRVSAMAPGASVVMQGWDSARPDLAFCWEDGLGTLVRCGPAQAAPVPPSP
jgi:hypothetical protein